MGSHEHAIEAVYPLSSAQEGILFHTALSTDKGIYTVQRLCTLPRNLDRTKFKDAWQQVIQRHTVLRTAFLFESAEEALQIVGRQVQLPWEEDDWRTVDADREPQKLAQFLEEDRARGFELTQAPLMRLRLVHRQDGTYYFLWSFHHVILDGWSSPLVLNDVNTCYTRACQGRRAHLPAAQPYQAYIAWLQRQDLNKAERYWRTYLRGIVAPTSLNELPGQDQEADYARHQVQLTPSLVDRLEELLQRHRLTVNTVLSGAWALLLSRYSGEKDVMFGTAVSGRPPELSDVEDMVGMFLNTLPVRVQVEEKQSILAWFQELQQQQAELRQYEYSPLVQVQKWSEVPRGTPLFQNILICGTARSTDDPEQDIFQKMGDVQATESTNYPLAINVEAGRPFLIQATYDRHSFDEGSIQRMLTHLQVILEQVSAYPEQRLEAIGLLSEAERKHLLVEWNRTDQEYPRHKGVHQLFEDQARTGPNAIAVTYEGIALTYRELDLKSNQLAAYLRKQGVGPEVLVALCVERSPEMIIGLLGILKAGGAYVPLDPQYPAERVAFILDDAACPLMLTQASLEEQFSFGETQAICLDRDWKIIAQESIAPLNWSGCPENLAYVIYTSGSTGKPKGTQIEHRAVINFLQTMQEHIVISNTDVWLAITTIAFDIAALEIFLPLKVGAHIVLASHEAVADGYQLAQLVYDSNATIMQATPATWRMLLTSGWAGKPDLKVLCGGEAMAPDLALQLIPASQVLWNLYGPTETTIWSAAAQITDANPITLGHPIANTQIYVLDAALRPVPVGVEGQLYIGGHGLARGYMRRPELTADRFIPDPFGAEPGGRLYLTGDRVRHRADGRLEYLGRADFQVKIRGFRIELGEIETILRQHPQIREAAVAAHEDPAGHKRLVAYIVASSRELDEAAISAQNVQDFLRQQLPGYMVPSLIIVLEDLPLTPNGKVDRRALPAPGGLTQQNADMYVEPRTKIERQLAEIWQQVLQVERVGIHDSFFAQGGDSILSVRIVVRARQEGLQFAARDLFQYQTIAELAQFIAQSSGVLAEPQDGSEMVPLTPIQRWFFERPLPDYTHWNQAFLFTASERLDVRSVHVSLEYVIGRYDALRLRFRKTEQAWEQWCAPTELNPVLHVFDGTQVPLSEQKSWQQGQITTLQSSLSLEQGPLIQVALFDFGNDRPQHLLFVIHHLAVDLTSWRVLLTDFENAYRSSRSGNVVQLAPVPVSFHAWSGHLQAYTRSLRFMRERSYWLQQPWDAVRPLPVDYPEGQNRECHTHSVSVMLTSQETQMLLREVTKTYHVQVHEVLLAVLAATCVQWTGGRAALIELEGHGREDILDGVDLSRTVGWLTALAPLCLNVESAKAPGDLLLSIKDQIRALPQGGIGYGLLRYSNSDEEDQQRFAALPRAEVVFHYEGRSASMVNDKALLLPADDVSASAHHPESPRSHLLAFSGQVIADRLRITITYSQQMYRQTTITQLLERYQDRLISIIVHSLSQEKEHFSPSDFPELSLNQDELDSVIESLY